MAKEPVITHEIWEQALAESKRTKIDLIPAFDGSYYIGRVSSLDATALGTTAAEAASNVQVRAAEKIARWIATGKKYPIDAETTENQNSFAGGLQGIYLMGSIRLAQKPNELLRLEVEEAKKLHDADLARRDAKLPPIFMGGKKISPEQFLGYITEDTPDKSKLRDHLLKVDAEPPQKLSPKRLAEMQKTLEARVQNNKKRVK